MGIFGPRKSLRVLLLGRRTPGQKKVERAIGTLFTIILIVAFVGMCRGNTPTNIPQANIKNTTIIPTTPQQEPIALESPETIAVESPDVPEVTTIPQLVSINELVLGTYKCKFDTFVYSDIDSGHADIKINADGIFTVKDIDDMIWIIIEYSGKPAWMKRIQVNWKRFTPISSPDIPKATRSNNKKPNNLPLEFYQSQTQGYTFRPPISSQPNATPFYPPSQPNNNNNANPPPDNSNSRIYVDEYTRKDGTHVDGYWRNK